MVVVLCVWSLRKSELCFFSVKYYVKIYRYVPYGYRLVLDSVSFWDAENSKGQSWGWFSEETCFCNQHMFCTRCFRKMSKNNRKPLKIHSSMRIVMCTNFFIILYILQSYPSKWAISVTEMHCSIYAVPKLTQI